jgi:hypothetical protein
MSETWADAMDSEAYEAYGEGAYDSDAYGEGAYDSEAYGDASNEGLGEESRSARRRRERQRQILLERQRQRERQRLAQRRPQPRPVRPAGPSPRQTIAAVRSLDLDTKVELDSLRRELKEANRRASRGTWATIAGVAAAEIINQFDALENHPNVSAAILGAPLLLLSPEKHGKGVEAFLLDPRVIGGAAVVGIAVASRFAGASKGVHRIQVFGDTTVEAGNEGTYGALAYDRNGNLLTGINFTFTFIAVPSTIIQSSDSTKGTFTAAALTTGTVAVVAQSGSVTGTLSVAVTPGSGIGPLDATAAPGAAPSDDPAVASVTTRGRSRSSNPGNSGAEA